MKEDMKMKKTSIKATTVTSFYPLYDEENEEERNWFGQDFVPNNDGLEKIDSLG